MQISCSAQKPNTKNLVINPAFDHKIASVLNFTVPVIGVEELHKRQKDYIILDAREKKEYDVSHIPGAIYIGYDDFKIENLPSLKKESRVVVYCSIGYRSEKIAEQIKKKGFNNIYNLYGSIFEWVNHGYSIQDNSGKSTKKLHTYNKAWSEWVDGTKCTKQW